MTRTARRRAPLGSALPTRGKARTQAATTESPARRAGKRRPTMMDSPEPETDAMQRLFRRYAETKDLRLRDDIVARHTYLVQAVAKKFVGMGEPYEDLVQEGAMGLLNAVDMYDPERGIKFSTYATHLVTGHIRHYLRDRGRMIRQPAWVQELGGKITKTAEALRHELKRDPSVEEIAARLNLAPEGVQEILSARERARVASLDAPAAEDEYAGPVVDVEKIRSVRQATLQLPIEDKILLQEATQRLKELERKVVRYFFYHDLNQTEIARRMGISVNYASYLLRGALNKLRATFESQSRMPEERAATAYDRAPVPGAAADEVVMNHAPTAADPVTGLACAPYFDERVRQEVERAKRYPQGFAVMVLDLPEGAAPPALAAPFANALRRSVRQVDVLARYSGTTFALLLPHTGREAKVLAERLIQVLPKQVAGPAPSEVEGPPAGGCATASLRLAVGYALYPADGRTAEHLIAGARRAAKAALAAPLASGEPAVMRCSRPHREAAAG